MNKRIILSTVTAIFILSGCSVKEVNKDFTTMVKKGKKTVEANKKIKEEWKKEEINADTKYIDLSIPTTLSEALSKLGAIDNKVYFLNKEQDFSLYTLSSKDAKKLHIDSFVKLKKYIESTTNKTIKIVKNKFTNGVKVVKVFEKEELLSNLNKIPFYVKGKVTVSDALQQIAEATGFNIVYTNDFNTNTQTVNTVQKILDSKKIYYSGTNVVNFLNYVSKMFDVYVNINYATKTITISKYKTKMFELITPEYQTTVQNATASAPVTDATTTTTASTDQTVTSNVQLSITTKFLNSVKQLIQNDPNSKILIAESGMVVVKTTRNNMQTIERMFEKYNNLYAKQLDIKVDVYEFALSKNYNYGADIDFKDSYNNLVTNFVTDYIYTYDRTNGGTVKKTDAALNSNIVRFIKKYSYEDMFTNNVPQSINMINNKDYLKSITTTTTTGTATTTQKSVEIGTITEGQILTILPRIYGNKVFIKSELKINTLNSLNTQNIDNNTITLPDVSSKIIPKTVVLNIGDRKILGMYETYEDVSNYNGAVPLEGFIIAGNNGKQYVRKLIAIVMQVKEK